jgi:Xaa-Pro aminopeptidase
MSEREIQGIHEFVYKKYGAADVGYPSIVGAGNNGCVLHYSHNELEQVNNQLVLMDLGAEYKGYTADVTRTIPANGRFTAAQRELYEVVYKAQEAAIAVAQVGTPFSEITQVAYAEVSKGLMALGIIEGADELRRYLPHGVTHHIGLDVHDPGAYEQLKPNMIITVEPGIYIPKGSPCVPKWWEIGIRIEDDILITTKGPVNLSAKAPRHWKAIEVMMQEDSVLREWKLPELED